MGLRKLVRGLSTSTGDLERQRLGTRFGVHRLGATPIADLSARQPVRLLGELTAVRVVPRSGNPWLEATVADGTGAVVAIFTGRRRIRGMEPGRAMLLQGVARHDRNRMVLMNPAYTLLP